VFDSEKTDDGEGGEGEEEGLGPKTKRCGVGVFDSILGMCVLVSVQMSPGSMEPP